MCTKNTKPKMSIAPVSQKAGFPRGRSAFTLVELLTVIAIIAVLAAIIFPAFSAARESARRGATISQMQKLYSAVKQYQLDNQAYPDYLFGPALKANGDPAPTVAEVGLTMEQAAALVKTQINGATTLEEAAKIRKAQAAFKNSLYPTYINDLTVYGCPDNPVSTTNSLKDVVTARRYFANPDDPETPLDVTQAYYKFDSFDTSPAIGVDGKINAQDAVYVARYSRIWFNALLNGDGLNTMPADQLAVYKRQLTFKTPGDDTYLTMTSYHVPNSKIIVLWLSGSAKVLDVSKLTKSENGKFNSTDPNTRDWDTFKMTPTVN